MVMASRLGAFNTSQIWWAPYYPKIDIGTNLSNQRYLKKVHIYHAPQTELIPVIFLQEVLNIIL